MRASDDSPGAPCLHLEPHFRFVRVLDAAGREEGIIRRNGIVPGLKYLMRRSGEDVWTLSLLSVVRKRHRLTLAGGETWTFDTPFFWWQSLIGSSGGETRLLGDVGPSKRFWGMGVAPGRDTPDLLAAVAFMHRNWWRS